MYPRPTPSTVTMTLLLHFLVVSLSRLTWGQQLPTRDEEIFQLQMANPESVADTKVLPDGAETKGYVFQGTRKFFYFVVEEDSAPVAITVTPCAAQLDWTLSLMDLPEDGSGSSDDQLSEQRPRRHPNPKQGTVVKTYVGYDVSTYVTYNSPAGIYTLEIKSPEKSTSVQIYATTTPDSDHLYPELPTDPRLDITSFRKNKVSLAWKPSPSDVIYREPIVYCVAINSRQNYHTWCSVQSCLYGDQPPAQPEHTGFGFEHERAERRQHRRDKTADKEGRARDREGGEEEDIIVECVGKKTLHTFTNLEPAKRYYFDLFAVDETNNRSVAYIGTSIITRPGPEIRKHIVLKDGKLRTSSVRKSSPVKTFDFSVGETVKDVMVTVQPCIESVQAEVWRDGTKIRSSNIRNLKDFWIRDISGDIEIKVKSLRRGSTHFRIFATTRPNKYPFPRLPDDKRIKVFENLRQCDSVTLAWLSTKEVSQYCLYKRVDKQAKRPTKRSRGRNRQCLEPDMRKRTEKVICRSISGTDVDRDVLMEEVSGLSPDTTYIFDVYVSSFGKQTLAYRSATVTTKKIC
ncbi:protein NDNF-like [Patiria miniata]|uniref:Protein NDNF n=1 Tax=Patiria miniata TaxID=46514 RepID=A0A914A8M0_PATMI|nr:protein NDNF-like [Patiria miniata]XP_038060191.1 protein NDNF-like [Patiria miniata]XP_038060193.1 protein NDNF-like [Patiria miniata]XP_038060194.1 protein NDNF-like [Patiria miniata]XP_038060195.1 protein NDNF-like [Patiria miniata]XP_038060196.1 protein NDNF-like [Patiria miniata]